MSRRPRTRCCFARPAAARRKAKRTPKNPLGFRGSEGKFFASRIFLFEEHPSSEAGSFHLKLIVSPFAANRHVRQVQTVGPMGEVVGQTNACFLCVEAKILDPPSRISAVIRQTSGDQVASFGPRFFLGVTKCVPVEEGFFSLSGEEGLYAGLPDLDFVIPVFELLHPGFPFIPEGSRVLKLEFDLLLQLKASLLCSGEPEREAGTLLVRVRDVIVFPVGSVEPKRPRRPQVEKEQDTGG